MWRHPYHLHPLDVANPAEVHRQFHGKWFCNQCQPDGWTGHSPVGRMWRCSYGCDFDMCDQCVGRGAIQRSPHEHPLVEADPSVVHRQYGAKWFCDGCQPGVTGFSPIGKMWRCMAGCDFDLCDRCCAQSDASAPGNGVCNAVSETGDPNACANGADCVICLSAARTTAFLPCGHFVACSACASAVMVRVPNSCPVCRQQLTGVQAIFT